MSLLDALFTLFATTLPSRRNTYGLVSGVPAPWPITVHAYELPGGLLRKGRKVGRKPWDWQPIRLVFTEQRVVAIGADAETVFDVPRSAVSLEVRSSGSCKVVAGDMAMSLSAVSHQEWLASQDQSLGSYMRHRLELALAGQVPGPTPGDDATTG